MPHDNQFERAQPVNVVDTGSDHDDPRQLEEGIALCLSGGGYRAMLFHLGGLWRLNELGHLPKLARVSSVSGGSVGMIKSPSVELAVAVAASSRSIFRVSPSAVTAETGVGQSSVGTTKRPRARRPPP
jgi:hypothetical protein